MNPQRRQRTIIMSTIAAIAIVYLLLARLVPASMAYSDFRAALSAGKITEVTVGPHWIRAHVGGVDEAIVRVDDPDL